MTKPTDAGLPKDPHNVSAIMEELKHTLLSQLDSKIFRDKNAKEKLRNLIIQGVDSAGSLIQKHETEKN